MSHTEEHKMHLFEHLRELRRRLVTAFAIILTGAVAAYCYSAELFTIISAPYFKAFPNSPLIGTSPTEAWILKLKVAVVAGAFLTSPALFHQLWLFVSPGLYSNERRLVIPFVLFSTFLFMGGAIFCYLTVLPLSYAFFHDEFRSIGVTPTIRIGDQVSMTVVTMLGFGAVFELPLVTYFLARVGLVDHRLLIRFLRHAVVAIFFIAAVLTPPDVFTQFLMAVPLTALYGVSIGIAYLTSRKATSEEVVAPPLANATPPL